MKTRASIEGGDIGPSDSIRDPHGPALDALTDNFITGRKRVNPGTVSFIRHP